MVMAFCLIVKLLYYDYLITDMNVIYNYYYNFKYNIINYY